MKIIPLGSGPEPSSYWVRWKNVSVLLDCGADLTLLQKYVPIGLASWSESFSSAKKHLQGLETVAFENIIEMDLLDAILITNIYNLASLPYLTEYCGFKGKIYATEATVQLGRQLLKEMAISLSQGSQPGTHPPETQLSKELDDVSQGNVYRKIYTEEEIEASFGKIRICSYDERLSIVGGLKISPRSSGYCIGACNWEIENMNGKKIVFAAQQVWSAGKAQPSSMPSENEISGHKHGIKSAARNTGSAEAGKSGTSSIGPSGSFPNEIQSTTYTSLSTSVSSGQTSSSNGPEFKFHPQPLKTSIYGNADCVILTQISLPGNSELDAYFGDMCSQIGQTLSIGGSVLIPISNAGLILDLFSIIDTYLVSVGLNPSVQGGISINPPIPIYYLSSVAHSILSYANISAEWLHPYHQERVYAPSNPFTHSDLIQMGRLIPLHSISGDSCTFHPHTMTSLHPYTGDSFYTKSKTGPTKQTFSSAEKFHSTDSSSTLISDILPNSLYQSSNAPIPPSNSSYAIHGIRNPSIILCGHPCLRFGDIVPLIELFKENPKNTVLFVDANYEAQRAFEPFLQNALCRLHVCPLDTRMNAIHAYHLIRQHSPKKIVISQALEPLFSSFFGLKSKSGPNQPYSGHLTNESPFIGSTTSKQTYSPEIITMSSYQTTKIKMERGFQKGYISSQLSASIVPRPLSFDGNQNRSGIPAVALVNAQISHRDGSFMIDQLFGNSNDGSVRKSPSTSNNRRLLFGSFVPTQILEELESMGIDQFEIIQSMPSVPSATQSSHTSQSRTNPSTPLNSSAFSYEKSLMKVRIPQLDATLCFSDGSSSSSSPSTRIITDRTESRKLLKELILRHLTK